MRARVITRDMRPPQSTMPPRKRQTGGARKKRPQARGPTDAGDEATLQLVLAQGLWLDLKPSGVTTVLIGVGLGP